MGLLDGGGASILTGIFSTIYPNGVLIRRVITEDAGGSQTASDEPMNVKVQVDTASEAMRQSAGYTDKDVRLIVLNVGVDEIMSDDIIVDHTGQAWSLIDPALDTCGSHWQIRGQRSTFVLPDYLISPIDGQYLTSPIDDQYLKAA